MKKTLASIRNNPKRVATAIACGIVLVACVWVWRIETFDISGVVSSFGLGSPIRGYDLDGRLIYSGVLRADDCVRSVNACRSRVEATGGGLCKVAPGSLRLRYEDLMRGFYERTKIAIEDRP